MIWTTRQRFDVGGHPVIAVGAGRPVLLLHGVGLRAEAWGAQLDFLGQYAQVIAPDMLGHGDNTGPISELVFDDYVEAAARVLSDVRGSALVVGHSMGAMIALALATRQPERVNAVAALNGVFERSAMAAAAVRSRASKLDGVTPVQPTETLRRWFGDARSPQRKACEDWLTSMDPMAYKLAYTAFAQSQVPSQEMLAKLHCPAVFVTGSAEPNSTPTMSRAMADAAPHGRAMIIDGAAHMMPMTHPEDVNGMLLALLNGEALND